MVENSDRYETFRESFIRAVSRHVIYNERGEQGLDFTRSLVDMGRLRSAYNGIRRNPMLRELSEVPVNVTIFRRDVPRGDEQYIIAIDAAVGIDMESERVPGTVPPQYPPGFLPPGFEDRVQRAVEWLGENAHRCTDPDLAERLARAGRAVTSPEDLFGVRPIWYDRFFDSSALDQERMLTGNDAPQVVGRWYIFRYLAVFLQDGNTDAALGEVNHFIRMQGRIIDNVISGRQGEEEGPSVRIWLKFRRWYLRQLRNPLTAIGAVCGSE